MHLLAAQPGVVADGAAAVDLGQTPGEIVVLSAADSEISCLAAAQRRLVDGERLCPSLRLARLLKLGHNYSVDLYQEKVLARAKLIIVRPLGGPGHWAYGVRSVAALARRRGGLRGLAPG